jgi:diguanylate cyclase (GGDEF)-like protein
MRGIRGSTPTAQLRVREARGGSGLPQPASVDGSKIGGTSGYPPARWPHAWWMFLVGCGVAIAVYQLLPAGLVQDIIYQVVGLGSVVAILAGVRVHRPVRRWPWYVMAAGLLVWSIADAVFAWDATIMGRDRFPSPADPLFLAGYPLIAAGLYGLIRARRPRNDVAGFLDSSILTISLGILSWVLLARPILDSYQDSAVAATVAVAYPVADILLLGLLVRLVSTPSGRTRSLWLLICAIVALIVVDTAASALDLLTFESSDAINFLWLLSYATWGAAALTPSMYALSDAPTDDTTTRFTRTRLALLTVAVLVAPATRVVQELAGGRVDFWAVTIGSVLMFVLVVARMNHSIQQIGLANQQVVQAHEALEYLAAHDPLTGLPNRREAIDRITGALARAQRSGAVTGLLFIDLDGFKQVNDTLGHAAGDELLAHVAHRMKDQVRAGDVVARLGGDEFVVLLEPLDQQASAIEVANRLIDTIAQPITLTGGRQVRVGASIGVAVNQDAVTEADILMQEADIAVYRAKHAGRGRVEIFDSDLRAEVAERTQLKADLAAALNEDSSSQLSLQYRPLIDLTFETVHGYAAVLRWHRPEHGEVDPEEFLPMAQRSELICDLDTWMLRNACRQLADWNNRTPTHQLTMTVPIAGRHLTRPRLTADVTEAIQASSLGTGQLIIEITDTEQLDDAVAMANLDALHRSGVHICVTDFGTSYDALLRFKRLPIHMIKLDRRFTELPDRDTRVLVELINRTAHTLGLKVVADVADPHHDLESLRSLRAHSRPDYVYAHPSDETHQEWEPSVADRNGNPLEKRPAGLSAAPLRPPLTKPR